MPVFARLPHFDTPANDFVRRAAAALITLLAAAAMVAAPAAMASSRHRHRHHAHGHRRGTRHTADARRCANADTPANRASVQQMRAAVLCLLNRERAQHHLPLLRASGQLNTSAQRWTNEMVASREFTHGSNFSSRISAAGYDWRSAGENIATGFVTPRGVMRGWMSSTGHCQNILNPSYRDLGTGVSPHPVPGFANGGATWTQDFGLSMSQSAPSGNWGPSNGCPYHG